MAKAPKLPPPLIGDRVYLKGRMTEPCGKIVYVNPYDWATIKWDEGVEAPRICSVHELAK